MEYYTLLLFGGLVGMQHALEADHLAAVAAEVGLDLGEALVGDPQPGAVALEPASPEPLRSRVLGMPFGKPLRSL